MDNIGRGYRPEPNVTLTMRCQTCGVYVRDAHLDRVKQVLTFWCADEHESVIEEFSVNI